MDLDSASAESIVSYSWILTPLTKKGHNRTNHTFKFILHQFSAQVTMSQFCLIHCCTVKNNYLSICQCTIKHVFVLHVFTFRRHLGDLLKSLMTVSMVTSFIPLVLTGNFVSPDMGN